MKFDHEEKIIEKVFYLEMFDHQLKSINTFRELYRFLYELPYIFENFVPSDVLNHYNTTLDRPDPATNLLGKIFQRGIPKSYRDELGLGQESTQTLTFLAFAEQLMTSINTDSSERIVEFLSRHNLNNIYPFDILFFEDEDNDDDKSNIAFMRPFAYMLIQKIYDIAAHLQEVFPSLNQFTQSDVDFLYHRQLTKDLTKILNIKDYEQAKTTLRNIIRSVSELYSSLDYKIQTSLQGIVHFSILFNTHNRESDFTKQFAKDSMKRSLSELSIDGNNFLEIVKLSIKQIETNPTEYPTDSWISSLIALKQTQKILEKIYDQTEEK